MNYIICATILIIAILITVCTFDTWQTVLMIMFLLICVSYLIIMILDRFTVFNSGVYDGLNSSRIVEGFEDEYDWSQNKDLFLQNENLFDDFYASVFTKLTQNEKLVQAETAICMEEFKGPKDKLIILDAACGIGIGTISFAKQGAGMTVGIDRSPAMIQYAKKTVSNSTLTDLQKQDIEFRTEDLIGPGAAAAAEFTNAVLLYFSVYYFQDLENLFRNLALWVKPGGTLAIEVVNKYKFEPILDSSNPWVGFSPQKYSKERLTKSKIVFDKFDYEAEFSLEDPKAEFRETFRFKDGSVRRQKHNLYMLNIPDIVKKAVNNGWTYEKYVDLMPISFPYGYLLFFRRNES